MQEKFDLVSIGGGLAGLSAAARAAELGANVALIEQGQESGYLCNTRYSGGVIHVGDHDVKLPHDELMKFALAATKGAADPALLEIMVSDTRRAIDWLRSCGTNFIRGYNQNWIMAPPRPFVSHIVWKGLGPDRTLNQLTRVVTAKGGKVLLGHRADSLIVENGRCVGIVALRGGEKIEIRSSAVVIADGGFQGNADMVRQYIGPTPEKIFPRNSGQSMGDGLRMAMAAGAATTRLNQFYGHLLSVDAFTNAEVWPYPLIDYVAMAGIMVDKSGKRLFDEGLGGIYLSNHLATLQDPTSGIVICDAPTWEIAGREGMGPLPANPRLQNGGGTLHQADTIEALARKASIDPAALAATVATYNAAIKEGALTRLSPSRSDEMRPPLPILTAPFFAIPVCPGITNTMGGLCIDIHGRVKGESGGTIEGLYAAGAATGGLEGGPKVVYIGNLCRAVVFGMRAAEHAVSAKAA